MQRRRGDQCVIRRWEATRDSLGPSAASVLVRLINAEIDKLRCEKQAHDRPIRHGRRATDLGGGPIITPPQR